MKKIILIIAIVAVVVLLAYYFVGRDSEKVDEVRPEEATGNIDDIEESLEDELIDMEYLFEDELEKDLIEVQNIELEEFNDPNNYDL